MSKIKILLGPPGTGKTTALTKILVDLLKIYKPHEIAFCSFTKEGVNQGLTKASEATGLPKSKFPYFRTLHSLAFKELELSMQNIIQKEHYKEFSKHLHMNFIGYYTEDLKHNDDKFLFLYDLQRNNPQAVIPYIGTYDDAQYDLVKVNYPRFKNTFKLLDFTDTIELFINQELSAPVKVAILDEAQDLTSLQWKMFWCAFGHCEKIYIAGDDDQAVFQWNGADVEAFIKTNGEIEILKQSYRLPNNILDFAKKIKDRIKNKIEKDYEGTGEGGEVNIIQSEKQLPEIDESQRWLFMSRNNVFLKQFEDMLQEKGILYTYKGELSIKEKEIRLVINYQRYKAEEALTPDELFELKDNCKDFKKIMNHDWTFNLIMPDKHKLYLKKFLARGLRKLETNVKVNSIHTSKGSEADNVVVKLDISKEVNTNLTRNPDAEHRCFYVAFTRAKHRLFVMRSSSRYEYPI